MHQESRLAETPWKNELFSYGTIKGLEIWPVHMNKMGSWKSSGWKCGARRSSAATLRPLLYNYLPLWRCCAHVSLADKRPPGQCLPPELQPRHCSGSLFWPPGCHSWVDACCGNKKKTTRVGCVTVSEYKLTLYICIYTYTQTTPKTLCVRLIACIFAWVYKCI